MYCTASTDVYGVHKYISMTKQYTLSPPLQLQVKLCDLGSAYTGDTLPLHTSSQRQTAMEILNTSTTPIYKAPECVDLFGTANTIDHKVDVWALGCVLYQLLFYQHVWEDYLGVPNTVRSGVVVSGGGAASSSSDRSVGGTGTATVTGRWSMRMLSSSTNSSNTTISRRSVKHLFLSKQQQQQQHTSKPYGGRVTTTTAMMSTQTPNLAILNGRYHLPPLHPVVPLVVPSNSSASRNSSSGTVYPFYMEFVHLLQRQMLVVQPSQRCSMELVQGEMERLLRELNAAGTKSSSSMMTTAPSTTTTMSSLAASVARDGNMGVMPLTTVPEEECWWDSCTSNDDTEATTPCANVAENKKRFRSQLRQDGSSFGNGVATAANPPHSFVLQPWVKDPIVSASLSSTSFGSKALPVGMKENHENIEIVADDNDNIIFDGSGLRW